MTVTRTIHAALVTTLLAPGLLSMAACDAPRAHGRGGDAGTVARDAAAASPDADARIDLGPLPPDPALDAMDRTRASSCPATARWIVAVRGRVVDDDGAAIEGAYVQTCLLEGGTDRRLCLRPAMSDAAGVVTAILPVENRCIDELALRIVVPESSRATGYCAVHEAPVEGVVVPTRPLVLVDTSRPTVRPPAGDETAPREVAFDGLTLTASPSAVGGAEIYEQLGARVLPGALATETCLGDGTAMDALVAFSPEASVERAEGLPTRLSAAGFAPGEEVELFVLGGLATTLADGSTVREAEWHRFGNARVAADGSIATADGVGLPYLGWLGMRRAR